MSEIKPNFRGTNVLITGGLGFIGSNIAHELVAHGARVTVLDNLDPRYGGNPFNIHDIRDRITVIHGDISDASLLQSTVQNKQFVFHLAAQVSYIDSCLIPYDDLRINCSGTLNLLEACRLTNSSATILFASSRLVYGKIEHTPVHEGHRTNPLSIYAIHKLACEKYFQMYTALYGLRTIVLRITNPYGIRQQVKHNKYSLPGWFLRQALESKTLTIFGSGLQRRDYIYIDDLVEIFMRLAIDGMSGEIYNAGLGISYTFRDMIESIVRTVGRGKIEYVPWPSDYERIETGDYETDISKLVSDIGWRPYRPLNEGISKMAEYYKRHFDEYVQRV